MRFELKDRDLSMVTEAGKLGVWAGDAGRPQVLLSVSSKPPEENPAPAPRRGPVRHWTPVAPDEFVTVDGEKLY